MIRVAIVDDHSVFRQSLAIMLSAEPDITVVSQAGSLSEASHIGEGVDVAILDLDLGDGDGASLIPIMGQRSPGCAVLILTASDDRLDLARAVMLGAMGLLHKTAGLEEIIAAVRRLGAGAPLLSAREAVALIREAECEVQADRRVAMLLGRLTARERDVLLALTDGMNDREIGRQLDLATETVRTHMGKILTKLEVDSRLQAAIFALRHLDQRQ